MENDHRVAFTSEQAKALAEFLAVVVKEGLTYKVVNNDYGWEVYLLGGW